MNRWAGGRLAWSLWLLCAALLGLGFALQVGLRDPFARRWTGADMGAVQGTLWALAYLSFPTVGALIVSRRPANAIGWLLCAMGVIQVVAHLANKYVALALIERPGSLPGGEWAAWVGTWTFLPNFYLLGSFILLFPDGRFPSPRWRVASLLLGVGALQLLATMIKPGPLGYSEVTRGFDNPLGVQALAGAAEILSRRAAMPASLLMLLSAGALVVRFRRAGVEVRQQIKWMAYAAVLFVGCFIATIGVLGPLTNWSDAARGLGSFLLAATLLAMPLAVGVAVLRYRLYDIDRIINRTLVYGALTLTLAAAYFGAVIVLQALIGPLTQGSQLSVAGSTLVVAGVFQPARDRIQSAIDRLFYRRKYDAQKTLDAFGVRLRDDVDLETLQRGLRAAVRETIQPAHVSLWLRPRVRDGVR